MERVGLLTVHQRKGEGHKQPQHAASRGMADRTRTPPQRKGVRQRNKPLVNKHSEKPPTKQMDY
jgi:hypothetical protein